MENNKNVILVALAIFSMVILLGQNNIDKVFALEAYYYNVTAPRNTVEILDGVTSSAFGNGGTSKFIGEGITAGSGLIGQQINKVGIHLEKVTDGQTLFGTIYVGFWNISPEPTIANALRIFGSMSANSVADAETLYNFTLTTGNYTIPVNSAVGAFYIDPIGSGSGSDGIYISGKNNAFGGNPTRATCHVNNSTTDANCFNTSVCTLGCGGQWSVDTTTDIVMLMSAVITESEVDNTCITNPETVFCRLGGTNDNSTTGIGGIVGSGLITLGCNVIFVDCSDDTNPATNGLGLLIFIASIFVVVGMFYWAMGTRAFEMPLFIWIVIIIALSAFFTIIGIIDPVFLIISIIAIVALSAPKVLGSLKGNTFGGGSTE